MLSSAISIIDNLHIKGHSEHISLPLIQNENFHPSGKSTAPKITPNFKSELAENLIKSLTGFTKSLDFLVQVLLHSELCFSSPSLTLPQLLHLVWTWCGGQAIHWLYRLNTETPVSPTPLCMLSSTSFLLNYT